MNGRGGITIRSLLDTSHLELSLVAGGGGVDRAVAWTHVSELEDPAPWLDGGELLMTNGLGLPVKGDAQARLLASLDERHAAGLGLGIRGPRLQPEFFAEAERRNFPVLSIPLQVPFLSIARMVADANQHSAQQRLMTHVRIFDTLRPDGAPQTSRDIFTRLEGISGYRLFLVSATGAPLARGFRRPTDDVIAALNSPGFDPRSGRPAVPGGYAVPVPIERRQGTFLVALETDGAEPAGLGAVRHMATIAALELSKLYYQRETLRRRGAESLAKLFGGNLDAAGVESALTEAGFDPEQPIIVVALRAEGGDLHDDEVHHRLCDLETPHLLLVDGDLYALLAAEPDVLGEVLDGLPLCAGVSRSRSGTRAWSIARKEAIWALERAAAHPSGNARILRFPSSDSSLHWLPTDIGALEDLVTEILEPLLSYDAEHNSAMLQSLKVYFDCDRRLQNAAAQLHVHKHTLSYRLNRIEQITGRDLSHMADLTQLWLALQAYEVVAERASEIGAGT
ncbi:MAG: PucR family transcriptional regulator [Solirubrobacteraceae bacterium]